MVTVVILGQLIQAGRRFCECRSHDFIPKSDDAVVVIAYSIHDEFSARSFDVDDPPLEDTIASWLEATLAIGYILVTREPKNLQNELPSPVGRVPMDRITFSVATAQRLEFCSFYVLETPQLNACNLIPTNNHRNCKGYAARNLFRLRETAHAARPMRSEPMLLEV